jgi:hypothetical protein
MEIMGDRRQEIFENQKVREVPVRRAILHDGWESGSNLFVVGSRF